MRPRGWAHGLTARSRGPSQVAPEVLKVIVRRSQWDSESYQFDTVFAEHTAQARPPRPAPASDDPLLSALSLSKCKHPPEEWEFFLNFKCISLC